MRKRDLLIIALIAVVGFILIDPTTRKYAMSYYDKLKSMIAGHEGLRLDAYQDVAGKWTIGYGHLITTSDPFYPYGSITKITQEEAEALFQRDISVAQSCVESEVTVPLTDNQKAALVSFIFNVGCSAFKKSSLLKQLNARNYIQAANELDKWVNANVNGSLVRVAGLASRRQMEKEVFLT